LPNSSADKFFKGVCIASVNFVLEIIISVFKFNNSVL